ncbi:MAG: hypothetical protein AB1523_11705 [Bacillota bacterium]
MAAPRSEPGRRWRSIFLPVIFVTARVVLSTVLGQNLAVARVYLLFT